MQIANVGFSLFTAVMGGYIAMSIAGRPGLAVGFMATLVAATPAWYVTYQQD
jgi:PTS system fructose-specific IIC component